MWHAHILSTNEYFAFCNRYNKNKYIHHNPTLTNGRALYKETLRKYEECFGYEPTWPIWQYSFEEDDGESEEDDDGESDEEDDDDQSVEEDDDDQNEEEEDDDESEEGEDGDESEEGEDDDERILKEWRMRSYHESEGDDDQNEEEDGESDWHTYWHTWYANYYKKHRNRVIPSCHHDWANGEFDIECDLCVDASTDIQHEDEPDFKSPLGRSVTCG